MKERLFRGVPYACFKTCLLSLPHPNRQTREFLADSWKRLVQAAPNSNRT